MGRITLPRAPTHKQRFRSGLESNIPRELESKSDRCDRCMGVNRKCTRPNSQDSCEACLQNEIECITTDRSTRIDLPDEEPEEPDSNPLQDVASDILEELKHLDLTRNITFGLNRVVNTGAFGDIFKGHYTSPDGRSVNVAMKRLRFHLKEDIKVLFEKEIYVWSRLEHTKILPLLGYVFDTSGFPVLVSEWMPLGSAWDYVNANPHCNPMRLVQGVARGLQYLHECLIVHSDLKSDNILVTSTCDARICDFGGTRMLNASRKLASMSSVAMGTSRYMAYELLASSTADASRGTVRHTKETDVWAFGMTVYDFLVRKRPYHLLSSEVQVVSAIATGQLPTLPLRATPKGSIRRIVRNILRGICRSCWTHNPEQRAKIEHIISRIESERQKHGVRILQNVFYDIGTTPKNQTFS